MVEEPRELIGKRIDFNILIKKANGLPEMLCKDTYVKYNWYLDNEEYRTEACEAIDPNPEWDYKHHMTIDYVTEDLLKYFENDALTFKVYGTPTNEKFRKQLNKTSTKDSKKSDTKMNGPKQDTTSKAITSTTDSKVVVKEKDGDVEVVKKSGCCVVF